MPSDIAVRCVKKGDARLASRRLTIVSVLRWRSVNSSGGGLSGFLALVETSKYVRSASNAFCTALA
jgi:hypothetical protein